jgi:hypothetical protein
MVTALAPHIQASNGLMTVCKISLISTIVYVNLKLNDSYQTEQGFNSLWHLSHAHDPCAVPNTSLKQLLHVMLMVVAFYHPD